MPLTKIQTANLRNELDQNLAKMDNALQHIKDYPSDDAKPLKEAVIRYAGLANQTAQCMVFCGLLRNGENLVIANRIKTAILAVL